VNLSEEEEDKITAKIDGGTAAQLAAECHRWEEAVVTFRTWTTVEQAFKIKLLRYLSQCI
jgi:hypothetical protein